MPPPSLYTLTLSLIQKHIHLFTDLGDMHIEEAACVLRYVKEANQLKDIQKNSPQLAPHTGKIWKSFIDRDFPREYREMPMEASSPKKWASLYYHYKAQADKNIAAAQDKLKADYRALAVAKEANKVAFIPGIPNDLPKAKRGRGAAKDKDESRKGPKSTGMMAFMKTEAKHRKVSGPDFPAAKTGLVRPPNRTAITKPTCHALPVTAPISFDDFNKASLEVEAADDNRGNELEHALNELFSPESGEDSSAENKLAASPVASASSLSDGEKLKSHVKHMSLKEYSNKRKQSEVEGQATKRTRIE